jgi:glycosyltransferase involved in cell wall biosynthesis
MENHLKIIFFDNGTASKRWRAVGQANRINKLSEHEMFLVSHKAWNGDICGANLVILEMLTGPKIIDECHKQGAKVIYEADDAVIDSYGRERKNLQHIGPQWRENAIETIKKCDAVMVDNLTLKENYARFTDKPIYVLPFYIDFNWYGREKPEIKRMTDEIRLGWFGSQGHLEDLKMIIPVIKKVLEKYSKVKFVYCGFGGMSSDRLLTEVGWGEDVFKEIPRERREFVIGVPEEYWPQKHRYLDFDIGISPLINDYFNRCKTYTKFLEYSTLGVPGVYSDVVYAEPENFSVVKHKENGFIAKSENDWLKYLSELIENEKMRKEMGKKAKEYVDKYFDLDNHWQEFLEVYLRVLSGK